MRIVYEAHQGCFDVNADRYMHKLKWQGKKDANNAYKQLCER